MSGELERFEEWPEGQARIDVGATLKALADAAKRISELEAALKPFARYALSCISDEGVIGAKSGEVWLQTYDDAACCAVDVTAGDFRNAAKALSKIGL